MDNVEDRKPALDSNIQYELSDAEIKLNECSGAAASLLGADRCEFVRSIAPVNTIPCFLEWFLEE